MDLEMAGGRRKDASRAHTHAKCHLMSLMFDGADIIAKSKVIFGAEKIPPFSW